MMFIIVSCLGLVYNSWIELFQVQELKSKMQSSGMPWPGDEGDQRWDQAWMAIKKVNFTLLWKYHVTCCSMVHFLLDLSNEN